VPIITTFSIGTLQSRQRGKRFFKEGAILIDSLFVSLFSIIVAS